MATYRKPLTDEEYFDEVGRCADALSRLEGAVAARRLVEGGLCFDDVIMELMEQGLTAEKAEALRRVLTDAVEVYEQKNPQPTGGK